MYDIQNIYQPLDLNEALSLAAQYPQAVLIAGGTDVLIQVREGKLAARDLLSLQGLSQLKTINKENNGDIIIGALCTFAQLEDNELIQANIPMLGQAAGTVGGPQIRAQGTIGGNVSNGVTSADTASTLFALEAELCLESSAGRRLLPIKDFYVGPGKTARQEGEILTKIIIRGQNYRQAGGCYLKYAMREAMDIATLGTAVLLRPDAAAKCIESIRIAFGVAGPVPMRTEQAEQALTGLTVEAAAEKIAALVRQEINPRDSWRASRDFRLQVAGVQAERALALAWAQALERRRG